MKYILIRNPEKFPRATWICYDAKPKRPDIPGYKTYVLGDDGWAVRMAWIKAPPEHDPITAAMFADWLMEYLPNDEYVMSVVNTLKTIAENNV